MLNTRSTLSTGLKAFRSFSTTQVAQKPLSNKTIEKLNRESASYLPVPGAKTLTCWPAAHTIYNSQDSVFPFHLSSGQ